MAFETAKTGYIQIDPTFSPGYPYPNKYHNIGQLETPYEGKKFGVGGDYAPPQRTRYYTPQNPNYPYVLDANFRAEEYLPTEGCCFKRPGYFPCYEGQYPDRYVPPNYFAPQLRHPSGHVKPINENSARMYSGMGAAFDENVHPVMEREPYQNTKNYDYRHLRAAFNPLEGTKHFYPFGLGRRY